MVERKEGVTYRLPSEAEWEFVCRSRHEGRYGFGNSKDELSDYGWAYEENRIGNNWVGQKRPNDLGLFDMHGNVWKWCQDWHGNYPGVPVTDPTGPETGDIHVARGGAPGARAEMCRSAHRSWGGINARGYSTGFCVAREWSLGLETLADLHRKDSVPRIPPTVTELSKSGDVEKPFAGPEGPLWHGLIAAPDLKHAKELYRHNFANAWPTVRTANGERGHEQNTYFVSADPGQVQGA